MLDEALLDNPGGLAEADTMGALRGAAMAGAQVRACAEQAAELGLGASLEGRRPRALILLTRGGAARTAAHLLAALLGTQCPVPVVLADLVPGWVGALDVVCGHVDDPGDRELASSLGRAGSYGADMVLTAVDEGPVAAAVAGNATLLPPRLASRREFARALTGGLVTAAALGLLTPDLDALADELDAEAARNHPDHESFVNPAKSLVLRLAERVPALWGLDPLATAVARRAAEALAAEAGVISDATDYRHAATRPGLHQAAVRANAEHDIFADPGEGQRLRVILLAARPGAEGEQARRAATEVLSSADLIDAQEEFPGDEPTRAAALALRFDFAAAYLGLASTPQDANAR